MTEQAKKTCFKEDTSDDGLKIKAATEGDSDNCASQPGSEINGQGSREPCVPGAEESDQDKQLNGGGDACTTQSSQPAHDLAGESKTERYTVPYAGLLRHRMIVVGCLVFSALILVASTINLESFIRRPAVVKISGTGSSTKSLRLEYLPPAVELPANVSFLSNSDEELSQFHEGLRAIIMPTWDGARTGFVNQQGKIVIKPRFHSVSGFHDGLAAAQPVASRFDKVIVEGDAFDSDNQQTAAPWGFIDQRGKYVIKPQYRSVSNFCNGVAAVVEFNGCAALIDRHGRVLFRGDKEQPVSFGSSYIFSQSGKKGLVDAKGHWLAPPQYDELSVLEESRYFRGPALSDSVVRYTTHPPALLAGARVNERSGVIDSSGRVVVPFKFTGDVVAFGNGGATIEERGKIGYVNTKGEYIIKPCFEYATQYAGLMAVKDDKSWSIIDAQGKPVKTPAFDAPVVSESGEWFSEGLAPVLVNGKVGYLNGKGEMAISPRFEMGTIFKEGVAEVWTGKFWRFIDKSGKYISPMKFETVSLFSGGKSMVSVRGPLFFLTAVKSAANVNDQIGWMKKMAKQKTPAFMNDFETTE